MGEHTTAAPLSVSQGAESKGTEKKRQRLEELRNLAYSDMYGVYDHERRALEAELGECPVLGTGTTELTVFSPTLPSPETTPGTKRA